MRAAEVKMDNEIKLLGILSKSYEKVLKDLDRIDKYLCEDDISYACEDIYDRMTNIIKEVSLIDGVNEENSFIKNYIEARGIVLHNTLKDGMNICTKYLNEIEDERKRIS